MHTGKIGRAVKVTELIRKWAQTDARERPADPEGKSQYRYFLLAEKAGKFCLYEVKKKRQSRGLAENCMREF